jgi:hypothetical protein
MLVIALLSAAFARPVSVGAHNVAVNAGDDSYTTSFNTNLVVASSGLRGNDSPALSENNMFLTVTANPNDGNVSAINVDGSFTYNPDDTFCGTDSFQYRLRHFHAGGAFDSSDTATVTITVDCPVVTANDDAYSTAFNTNLSVAAPGVRGNDSISGNPNPINIDVIVTDQPDNGVLVGNDIPDNNGVADDGAFVYDPNDGFCGDDTFTYDVDTSATGPTPSDSAIVTVTVDCPTPTPTNTPTEAPTETPTNTPTNTPTETPTNTPTDTPTETPTNTPTDTPTDTPTETATNTPVDTATSTPVDTETATPVDTETATPVDTETATPVDTETATAVDTETATAVDTETATPVDTATNTATNTATATATATATKTATPVVVTAASIFPQRTTVNNWIHYSLTSFPHNAPVTITWRRLSGTIIPIDTINTNSSGNATGKFRVPATPGGPGQLITFKSGSVSKTVSFEVAPRIKVIYPDASAQRGQFVDVSLRGYAKNETVRIRWQDGDGIGWRTIATVVTSNTGSKNIILPVPSFARNGIQSVRGDGTIFRQQTNVVNIQGGPGPTPPMTSSGSSTGTVNQHTSGFPKELMFVAVPILGLGFFARRRLTRKFRA